MLDARLLSLSRVEPGEDRTWILRNMGGFEGMDMLMLG
jgi:hypothetical protein